METEKLTADDLYRSIMDVWARRAKEERGDHDRMNAETQTTGAQRAESAA
jgi:hypothetical protein